jgi:hypothetical protein
VTPRSEAWRTLAGNRRSPAGHPQADPHCLTYSGHAYRAWSSSRQLDRGTIKRSTATETSTSRTSKR